LGKGASREGSEAEGAPREPEKELEGLPREDPANEPEGVPREVEKEVEGTPREGRNEAADAPRELEKEGAPREAENEVEGAPKEGKGAPREEYEPAPVIPKEVE
jgi:hypothetical protein